MRKKSHKILELAVLILIIILSIVIFLFRDKIENVSNLSYVGLFFACLLANATVLLPSPSLMIAASCALIMNPILVALFSALGSTVGELVGYVFGKITQDVSPQFQKFITWLNSKVCNDTILVFVLAVLPLPLFDVVGVYSGGKKMNLVKFCVACLIGKFVKTLLYTKLYDILDWGLKFLNLGESIVR